MTIIYKLYNKLFSEFEILEFNYQWYKWGAEFHDLLPLFSNRKYSGLFFQTLRHFYFLIKNFCLIKKNVKKCDFIVFFETANQKKVLIDVCKGLVENKNSKILIIDAYDNNNEYQNVRFDIFDIFYGIYFAFKGLYCIFKKVKNIDTRIASNQLSDFLSPYVWARYFIQLLIKTRPKFVLLSNDHNPSNRTLIAICNLLEIKTIYIQHASITKFMPPICCDINFLFGKSTQDLYSEISFSSSYYSKFDKSDYKIVLSGIQKKRPINISTTKSEIKSVIGIAINHDDPINEVQKLIDELIKSHELEVILRYHPSQSIESIRAINTIFSNYNNVSIIPPNEMSIEIFFSNIIFLIAGNSAILLESTTNLTPSFYYRFDQNGMNDMYNFVKNGLVKELNYDSLSKLNLNELRNYELDNSRIQYFDYSYNNIICYNESAYIANYISINLLNE